MGFVAPRLSAPNAAVELVGIGEVAALGFGLGESAAELSTDPRSEGAFGSARSRGAGCELLSEIANPGEIDGEFGELGSEIHSTSQRVSKELDRFLTCACSG